MQPNEWVEIYRDSFFSASGGSRGSEGVDWIRDFLRAYGIEAVVSTMRPRSSNVLWDMSRSGDDTISVFVKYGDLGDTRRLLEELASGKMEIDETFDPGEPEEDV